MSLTLTLERRSDSKPEDLRSRGVLPAIVYGPQISSMSVQLPYKAFMDLYAAAGESTLIEAQIPGEKPLAILVQEIQHDPVTGKVIHVDFRQINMDKEMRASIPFKFVGEASAVKELGGTLVKALQFLNIQCLPKDLVSHIDIALEPLKTFQDVVRIKDIKLPAGITVLDDLETTITKVQAPMTEDQLKALEESGPKTLEDIEVEEKGKKEDEEAPAEGEAPAAEAPKKE